LIKTSRQLKDKVHNLSKGESKISQSFMRTYMMEQFLYRVALSEYKERFVLKGGLLIANIVGNNLRMTKDIDTSIKATNLSFEEVRIIIEEIASIDVGDNITYEVCSIERIMESHKYSGIRIIILGRLDNMKQMISIDISTGDIITPAEIVYEYETIFGEKIKLYSYNLETILAEKIEAILSNGLNNTRMKDYYDIYIILNKLEEKIDFDIVRKALERTIETRDSKDKVEKFLSIIDELKDDLTIKNEWALYQTKNSYAKDFVWEEIIDLVIKFVKKLFMI